MMIDARPARRSPGMNPLIREIGLPDHVDFGREVQVAMVSLAKSISRSPPALLMRIDLRVSRQYRARELPHFLRVGDVDPMPLDAGKLGLESLELGGIAAARDHDVAAPLQSGDEGLAYSRRSAAHDGHRLMIGAHILRH